VTAPRPQTVPPAATAPAAYPPWLLRFVALVVCAALPALVAAAYEVAHRPVDRSILWGVGACILAAIIAELKPVPLDDSGSRIVSLAFVFMMACQILFGWEWAALAALASTTLVQAVERAPVIKATFNAAVWVLAALASGIPAALLGWNTAHIAATDAMRLTVLAVSGGLAYIAVNVVLVSGAVALQLGVPVREVLEEYVREAGAAFAVMALVAALAASLWKLSPGLEPLLAGPLFALALSQRYARRSAMAVRAAETDGLTGLGNHRSFQTALGEVLQFSTDHDQPAALCLIDLDDFKSVNDRFGHPAGDRVLVRVAELLREEFEGFDTFRIGGEEFAVLLPGVSGEEAYRSVERLHHQLARTQLPHGEPTTVSAGIASFPDSAGEREELLRVADGALYWSKHHGKNRSCLYSPGVVRIDSPQELARTAERIARLRAAESLIRVVDAKDTYAGAHSQSVARLVEGIARAMGLDDDVVEQVRLAGLLHDLGKIAIPDRILQKPGRLEPDELRVMREHPELGCRLLQGLGVSPVDRWIRHHHEWWDGSGYPDGLAGEEIPLGSRIILVADTFDAMTSDRCYRPKGTAQAAVAELRRRSWTQFDARIVAALERHLASPLRHPLERQETG
jgi:diguanylate cyclase (GGDEF)-like protein/putative nucleotidyltransferase with HDIG domain